MEALLQQVIDKDFKPSNFTVYSIIEEDGFVVELEGMFEERFLIDDFEYMVLDLSIKEKNGILYHMSFMMDRVKYLKKILEEEIQDNPLKPKTRIYVNKDKCFIFVVKLKDFDLKERLSIIEIGDEQDNTSPIME